jgi:ParB-like chromosome segregation protein Spo0J
MHLAEQITLRPVAQLLPYARNSRTHSPEQIAQIAASIKEFGFTNPVLVDGDNGIIAGHARVMAAQLLGLEHVPTIELAYLTPAQRQAYVIADNRLAENAGWDRAMLRIELAELKERDFDLSLTGFGELELGALFAEPNAGLTDPDDAPAAPEHPVTRPGDLWLLGTKVTCPHCRKVQPLERAIKARS